MQNRRKCACFGGMRALASRMSPEVHFARPGNVVRTRTPLPFSEMVEKVARLDAGNRTCCYCCVSPPEKIFMKKCWRFFL